MAKQRKRKPKPNAPKPPVVKTFVVDEKAANEAAREDAAAQAATAKEAAAKEAAGGNEDSAKQTAGANDAANEDAAAKEAAAAEEAAAANDTAAAKPTTGRDPANAANDATAVKAGKDPTAAESTIGKDATAAESTTSKSTAAAKSTTGKDAAAAKSTTGKDATAARSTTGKDATAAKSTTGKDATAAKSTTGKDAAGEASRGKQRRAAQRQDRETRVREAPAAGPVEEPAFFFGFEVTWAKLVLTRVVFFMLLALDALLQISHAPRYGAGGFNVSQLPLLDAIAPGRELYSVVQLVSTYLFVLAACGVATRVVLPIATVLYGWMYFSSHLDSYQHHYLVWLLLVIACFVPWQRPVGASPGTRVRSWALRLMLIQLAILYLWTAVSKMSSAWLDGQTLAAQMKGPVESLINATVKFSGAAWMVLIAELVLACTVWFRRTWPIAAPLGLALHIGILKTDLEIGLFAWLMIGLYILIIPDVFWVWLADLLPFRVIRGFIRDISAWFDGSVRFVIWIVAAVLAAVLAMLSRFADGPAVGLGLVVALVIGTLFAVFRMRTHVAWLAIAHLLAFMMWTAVDRTTSIASDYYRLWGGSSRRLGDPKTAEQAYRKMTEVAPDKAQGWFQLGKLLLAREAGEEGLAALRKAQDLERDRARAYVAEARWLATHGKLEEAIGKARLATIAEPTDAEAKALLDSLLRQ